MTSGESGEGHLSRGSEGDSDLEQARALAAFVDALAAGDIADAREFLTRNRRIAAQIAVELETLDELAATVDAREPGPKLADFRILRELGRGSVAIVHEAEQLSRGRTVALKVLPAGLLADDQAAARFQEDAARATSLHHPNIVQAYASGVEGGTAYHAMELVKGESLESIRRRLRSASLRSGAGGGSTEGAMRRLLAGLLSTLSKGRACGEDTIGAPQAVPNGAGKPPDLQATLKELNRAYCVQMARAFAGAADGLEHAHSRGVLHQGLRPSSLILDSKGDLRILDFGLAWAQSHPGLAGLSERQYRSPEQARGPAETAGPASDIYSLGASLRAMLAWGQPFEEKIPAGLEAIVEKCLERDPRERYQAAAALAEDLCHFFREPINIDARSV